MCSGSWGMFDTVVEFLAGSDETSTYEIRCANWYPQTFFPNYTLPQWCNENLKSKTKIQFPRSARREANHYSAKITKNQ